MNYKKHYDLLIQKYGLQDKPDYYVERHHIVPKCIGGSDNKDNLVYLEARHHYMAHALLAKSHSDNPKLVHAYWMMCNAVGNAKQPRYKVSGRMFAIARAHISTIASQSQIGKEFSNEHKTKLRNAALNRNKSNRAPTPQNIVTCPHCKKTGQLGGMKRWHFDRCKSA
jgi:hypothetical protein